jgi:chromosome segregation ATPase
MNSFENLASLFYSISKEYEKAAANIHQMEDQIASLECDLNKERERNQKLKNVLLDLVEVLND